jgi:uncharacterized LabA/DUF88 family protein
VEKVITYIDGFNLYFGLKSKGWKKFYWLNIYILCKNLLKPHQKLIKVKYFTSRISEPPEKRKRQTTYIEALETLPNFEIFYGKYQSNKWVCNSCGAETIRRNEKMTDVNIAVELMKDAFYDNFDSALLISADSDLKAPIVAIKEMFPGKRIVVVFPPERKSYELSKIADAYFHISRSKLAKSLFPEEVKKEDGYILKCPDKWK